MAFMVSTIRGTVGYDTLPVAKVTNYPAGHNGFRPYAQAIICMDEEELHVRMWAFEVSPPLNSELRGVFYLFEDQPGRAIHLRAVIENETQTAPVCTALLCDETGKLLETVRDLHARDYSGEDLQGIYWGATFTLPRRSLAALGRLSDTVGAVFAGNIYKLCPQGEFKHNGAMYPADFAGNSYGRDSMGEFKIAAY